MVRVSLVLAFLAACKNDYLLDENTTPEDTHPPTETGGGTTTIPDTDTTVGTDTDGGTADTLMPVAVCTVEMAEVMPPFQQAAFDGSASYDPEGHAIVTWQWWISSQPQGSSAILVATDGTASMTPDLAGDYVIRLSVGTDDGRVSLPTDCSVTAIPGQDLWVEMYWAHRHDDMDLHLIRPGGHAMQSPSDCYFGNPNPNWGDHGTAIDDPRLDLDDIPGKGPENINIDQPYETGAYTVMVHDWTGSNLHDYHGTNDVTVNIYIGGVLVWSDTRGIAGEHTKEKFAEINWPDRTVTPL